ncbi:MAG: acetoin utilization protein AcuC [Armatimonadetes bacterium]|nr:acetoin utilization protein AcuC [Armatimonadota bacterium]
MPSAKFVYHPDYRRYRLSETHPLKPRRLQMTWELLTLCGAFRGDPAEVVEPVPATEEEALQVHTPDYLETVKTLSAGRFAPGSERYGFSHGDTPPFEGMYGASLLYTGGTLTAARLVASGQAQVAFNISGGLHHAMPGRAAGFCIFNDAAIAICDLLKSAGRVCYLDIDAHHGDGVQAAFYDTDRVLTVSLHESGRYLFPGTGFPEETGVGEGAGYAVNLPLAPHTDDEIYLWAFDQIVPPLVQAYRPDFLVAQLGADTHFLDPLTHLDLTVQGHAELYRRIGRLVPRWVAVGGGGYDLTVVSRSWTLAYRTMAGKTFPEDIPPEFADRYGVPSFFDARRPPATREERAFVRRAAEGSVGYLRRHVFPIHGL